MINIINLITGGADHQAITFAELNERVTFPPKELALELMSCVREGHHPQGYLIFYEKNNHVHFARFSGSGPYISRSMPQRYAENDKKAHKLRDMLIHCYDWSKGDRVSHSEYGEGTIECYYPLPKDNQVIVVFDHPELNTFPFWQVDTLPVNPCDLTLIKKGEGWRLLGI